ncbi:integrase [Candidatus Protofrankia californiensis]|uniref:Integrase n=1 Tax=Candidatus Protofrankia californiensis TaxID=1839754 RepID=A0A1C3PEL4_9ACTN|nr:integrase [Candidatus Protofrankia californiensis]
MARHTQLSIEERETISRKLSQGKSARWIGGLLDRHHSTIPREIERNGGEVAYRAIDAQRRCDENRLRPKERKLEASPQLHDAVNDGLREKWSPKQISERLKTEFPDDEDIRVSHETIYECLYLQARGELRTELTLALRKGRTRRVNRSRTTVTRGRIVDMVNISERPKEAEDRAVPGFWEGDLIIGKGNRSQIATLVERTTRFVMLVRIPYGRNAERVAYLLARKMETLPEFLRNSVTWDQGKEMARHADFTVQTGMPVYFCDPHSPWQRGSNENTNGLLRQYFPKGADLSLGLVNSTAYAYRQLVSHNGANMKQGDVLLIWGASGGLGSYATQMTLHGGAIPVCVVSSLEKAEIVHRMGADLVIDRAAEGYQFWTDEHTQNLREWQRFGKKIRQLTGGEDPDIVFEHPGRETFGASVYVTHRGGTIVTCASTSGFMHSYDNRYLWMNLKKVIGSYFANYREAWEANRLIAKGLVHPTLSRVYPLAGTGQAAYDVHRNRHQGKVGVLCFAPEEGLGVRDSAMRARHLEAINRFRGV